MVACKVPCSRDVTKANDRRRTAPKAPAPTRGLAQAGVPRAGIFGCWLALYLIVTVRQRIEAIDARVEWNDLIRDLGQLRAIEVTLEGQRFLLRTDLAGCAHVAFKAAGVKPS